MLLPSTAWLSTISTLKRRIAYNDTGNQEPISRGLQRLQDADSIIGHNIISYDLPVIRKLYSWFNSNALVVDTLLLSRLYHADMMSSRQEACMGEGCLLNYMENTH